MNIQRQVLLLLAMGLAQGASSQLFTPMPMRALPVDFPGLSTNYTSVIVDANFAPSGPANWGLVETVAVTRDASNNIIATELSSTFPVPIVRANATLANNVTTSMVEIKSAGVWKPYQREMIYSDGSLDTASNLEQYDSVAMVYKNTDHWSMSYNTSGQLAESWHYIWNAGTWQLKDKRVFTYNGTEYAGDTTYLPSGSSWDQWKASAYYYVAGRLDSTVLYESFGGVYTPKATYKMGWNNSPAEIDTIINFIPDATGGWKTSSRIIFTDGTNSITDKDLQQFAKIFPNPAEDFLTVQFKTGVQAERISLNDMTGKLVLQTQANANEISIDLRQVPPGMYLLTMHRRNGTPATAQIIVRP